MPATDIMTEKPLPDAPSFIIAIDGPNASGKGTLTRRLSAALGFPALDTGLLYRAVGWLVIENKGNLHSETDALHAADALHERIQDEALLSNPDLRKAEIGNAASIVSAFPSVRQSLFDLQRGFALRPPNGSRGAILDGRDIGTIICPDAKVKLFVTAKPEIRAERRARELHGDAWRNYYDAMLLQTVERDKRDSERVIAPLKPAEDAIIMDTSDQTIEQVFERAMGIISEALKNTQ